jgi:hypothetical protein
MFRMMEGNRMKKAVATIALTLLVLAALPASAATVTYSWEDGGTVLGLFGSGDPPIIATNVGTNNPVWDQDRSLRLEDNSPSGTPQAYVAWIKGLQDGDQVDASIWRYDEAVGEPPSTRIWGHWNDDPDDVYGFNGSAGGNDDYGPESGWDMVSWSWTVGSGHTGLVVEMRTYSEPGDTVWVDLLEVTAPDHATIVVAPEPGSLALLGLGAVAALRRRRSA